MAEEASEKSDIRLGLFRPEMTDEEIRSVLDELAKAIARERSVADVRAQRADDENSAGNVT